MTSNQATPAGRDNRDHQDTAPVAAEAAVASSSSQQFGARLRAAREARGMDLESCAHTLRLPSKVLRQLERGELLGIDYQVYLSSYIGKYARFLGVDEESIHAALRELKSREPTLVATGGISHSRYLLERYATAATYVVLTAVIVVPMVWLGVRGALDRDMSHLSPLDAAPVAQQDAASSAVATNQPLPASAVKQIAPAPVVAPPHVDEQPLMASMMPNLGETPLLPAKPALAVAPPASVGAGQHALQLDLANASWVEVTDKNGQRLEYGLLPAGSSKTYHSDQPLDVRIGNANGASVTLDGQPLPLDDYRRANVAHFKVAVDGGKAVPSGV